MRSYRCKMKDEMEVGTKGVGALGLAVAMALIPVVVQAGEREVTLQEVQEVVPERHETREITEMQIRQSQAMRRQALAALLPQASLSASVDRQSFEAESGGQVFTRNLDWSINGGVRVTVFDGPAYFDYWQAGASADMTRERAQWERHLLMLDAEVAFYTLASAQREVEIAESAVEWREQYLEQAEALKESGMAVSVDVGRARVDVLEAEQALLEAETTLGNAADGLAVLMAEEADGSLRADAELDVEDLVFPEDADGVSPDRSDFEAMRSGIEASELGRRGAWWSLAPRVDLSLNTNWGRTTAFNPDRFNWSVTLSATWDLYDGGARYARADAAQAEVREQELELERDLRQANAELVEALREWRSAKASVEVGHEQVEVARENYEQTVAQFESGLVSSLEVRDASQELLDSELGLNQRQLQVQLAEVRYRYLKSEGDET